MSVQRQSPLDYTQMAILLKEYMALALRKEHFACEDI